MDVQATAEAPHLSKENIQHFEIWNFFTFSFLWDFLHFWIRIRIQPNKINADLDPKHLVKENITR